MSSIEVFYRWYRIVVAVDRHSSLSYFNVTWIVGEKFHNFHIRPKVTVGTDVGASQDLKDLSMSLSRRQNFKRAVFLGPFSWQDSYSFSEHMSSVLDSTLFFTSNFLG